MKKTSREPGNRWLSETRTSFRFYGIVLGGVLAAGVLAFLGYKADAWLGLEFPAFFLLGLVAGIVSLVRQLLIALRKK